MNYRRLTFLFLIMLVLTACGSPSASPTATNVPATTSLPATHVSTSTPLLTTLPPPSSMPPSPTARPAATSTPAFTATPCIDKARFVNETVPDNTVVAAGAPFVKVWILENTGTCPWDTNYQLNMSDGGGLTLAGVTRVMLSQNVPPGARVNITATLTAPFQAGTYRSDFLLMNNQKQTFGVGASSQTPIYAQVVVEVSATAISAIVPTPQANCTYRASYISETIPDNTKMFPGERFDKSWTVKNTGTCTWINFNLPWLTNGGLRIGAPVPREGNPGGNLPPGGTITLGKPLIAPQAPGTYRDDFKLGISESGIVFGLGQNGDVPLYVQIVVVDVPTPPNAADLNLGAPTWFDNFDANQFRWALAEASNNNVNFSINTGGLVMDVQQGEYWTVGSMPSSRGQVHQAVFQTGAECVGQNAYGLLVGLKASASTGAFTNGYMFRFTCEGQYSVGYAHSSTEIEQQPLELVGLTPTAALHPGPNQTNRVLVVAAGGKVGLYINDSKVLELKDLTATQYENGTVTRKFPFDLSMLDYGDFFYITPGRPGLFISGEASPFTVVVDEYSFWDLDAWVR